MAVAQRIVIDRDALTRQAKTLDSVANDIGGKVHDAQSKISDASFGVLNSFLVGTMNLCAGKTAELVAETSSMTRRMSAGVHSAVQQFYEYEEQVVEALSQGEGEE